MAERYQPTAIAKVYDAIRAKQRNEYELSTALLRVFNDGRHAFIAELRDMVRSAADEIMSESALSYRFRVIVHICWMAEARHNKIGPRYGSLSHLVDQIETMRAEHCSDFIRLYGEIVEMAGRCPRFDLEQATRYGAEDRAKSGYRKDWQHARIGEHGIFTGPVQGSLIWDKKRGGGRRRGRSNQARPLDAYEAETGFSYRDTAQGGIAKLTLKPDNTSAWIDRLFGLQYGATISGTTTDTIFFLDRFGGGQLDPIFYLLPAATIVQGGHHTMLEVGSALTINRMRRGVIGTGVSYSIGLYRTLMPSGSRHKDKGAIERVLVQYEGSESNRLMLIYMHSKEITRPLGWWEFEKRGHDRAVFELLASADDNLMQHFRWNQSNMTRDRVEGLMDVYGLKIDHDMGVAI